MHRDYFVLAVSARRCAATACTLGPWPRRAHPSPSICAAAKRASRRLARLDSRTSRTPRCTRSRTRSRSARRDPRGQRARHGGRRARPGSSDALLDRLRARRGRASRRSPRGARADRGAARPGRRGDRRRPPAQRARRAQGARAARRRRRGLRGAAERDDRRRRAVPEVGQRDRAARLLVGGALQRGARGDRLRGRDGAGLPEGACRSSPAAGARSWPSWRRRTGVVDLIIPRGGEGLKKALKGVATVPVIYAASGNCHVYVDATADLDDGGGDRVNAKVQRPGVCNAAETLLVHADVAAAFLPRVAARAARAPASSCASTGARARWPATWRARCADASEEDWDTEYLALVLAVGVVDSVDEAIEHVNRYGSRALGGDRHRATAAARRSSRRRRGLRLRQRVDALHRRRRVRHGRRDRQLDAEAARARADRAARAVHATSTWSRATGTSARELGASARRACSAGRSTRRTSGTWSARRRRCVQLGAGPRAAACRRRAAAQGGRRTTRARRCGSRCAERPWRATSGSGVCELEVERGGASYTVDTLRELHARAPGDELTFIVGGDMAASLPSWREPERAARARHARRRRARREPARPGSSERCRELARAPSASSFFDMPRIDISSSTMLRARVARGRADPLPRARRGGAHIAERGLYAAARDGAA